jgi:hypothetical protein
MQKRNEPDSTNRIVLADGGSPQFSRRSFFKRAGVAGAAGLVAAGGLTTLASVLTKPALAAADDDPAPKHGLRKSDREILIAAEIAEALAVTTYSNIILHAPSIG